MLQGFHHVTAIAGDPQRNLDFYTGFLGLRLVKHTVNFDDPATHHFYFGDRHGSPGTLITFFPWSVNRISRRGTGQVTSVAFRTGALDLWQERAAAQGITVTGPRLRFGELILTLTDPDGLDLDLVDTGSASLELENLHSVTICENDTHAMASLLTGHLGFEPDAQESSRTRFLLTHCATAIDLLAEPETERGKIGPGAVHHLALAVAGEPEQEEWRAKMLAAGYKVTLPQDRRYFRSIYFRQPRSVLFELATLAPGFTVDEPLKHLGESLCLPPWLETIRESVESRLAPVQIPAKAAGD